MIKISDRLWFVTHSTARGNLAYMCSVEETKSGELSAATKKMQETGRSWARVGKDVKNFGEIIENTPTEGIYVGSSVSRWSTSNKFFRVTDPRGFTVEIPTGNLATLLHHTTVINGYVQDKCVWGRSEGSHILLPINSEPYKDAIAVQEKIDNDLIKVKDLKVGDVVKMFNDDNLYHFFGRVKVTWSLQGVSPYHYWKKRKREVSPDWHTISDDNYTNIFLLIDKDGKDKEFAFTPSRPKIVEVVDNRPTEIEPVDIKWVDCSKNVRDKLSELIDTRKYSEFNKKILSVQHKGEK